MRMNMIETTLPTKEAETMMTEMLPTKEWTITKGLQGSEDDFRTTMMKERTR